MKRDLASLNARFGVLYRVWLLGVLMLGSMVMVLSSTSINVALPAIMDEFAMGRPLAQWLATGFLAAMTAGLLLAAWAQAKLGSRLTVQISIGLFVVCSIVALVAIGDCFNLSRLRWWWPRCSLGCVWSWLNDCAQYRTDRRWLFS